MKWRALALAIIAVVLITTKGDFDSVSLSLTGVLWGLASSVAGAASNIQPNAVLKKIPVTIVVGGGDDGRRHCDEYLLSAVGN